jgi:diguanylate cyclase (GGDEF)-like protein
MRDSSSDDIPLDQLLAQARLAQQHCDLGAGLLLAEQAWQRAGAEGFGAEQAEAGRLRCFFRFRRGDLAGMLEAGQQSLALLRPLGPSCALGELLRWMSLAACELGDFELGLACAHEGLQCAGEAGDPRARAIALNGLGACFERMGDPWQAERLMHESAALLRDGASPFERVITLNNLCTVALGAYRLLRDGGQADAAHQALLRALEHAREVRPHACELADPFAVALTDTNLGEVLLQLDELDEAQQRLDEALHAAQQHGFELLAARLCCALAELQLARHQARPAWLAVEQLEQALGAHSPGCLRQRLHQVGYRAAKALALLGPALQHLERGQALERQRAVMQLMAQSRYFVTRLEVEQAGQGQAGASRGDASTLQDPLTGLGNRRCLELRLPPLLREAEQEQRPLTVALIDADGLRLINDRHGHSLGDRVLQELAQLLRENTRSSDLLLRWSGEEFLVIFPDTVADRAFEVCERIRASVSVHRWQDLAPGLDVTLSMGLASAPPYATDMLIARADAAVQRAKHLGRNRVALA